MIVVYEICAMLRGLIVQLSSGNSRALRDIMDVYQKRLYKYALQYVKNEFVAEEIVEDVFVALWNKHTELKDVEGTIAIGDPESVPAGQYANESLHNLGIWDDVEPKLSLATDVTAVLNQVAQGSAEYGLVYSTDAKSTDSLKTIVYPVAPLADSQNDDATAKFMEFLQSQEAKDIFVEYGFTIHDE